ncbi:hypothetical protein [Nocardioides pacificus]
MRTQTGRDEQTVAIAVAIALCLLVLAVGGVLLWAGHFVLGWDEGATETIATPLFVVAVGVPVGYLLRQRRR